MKEPNAMLKTLNLIIWSFVLGVALTKFFYFGPSGVLKSDTWTKWSTPIPSPYYTDGLRQYRTNNTTGEIEMKDIR